MVVEAKKTPKGTDVLNVVWSNQKTQEYPAVWLRDNCQCSKCYQASALARLSIMKNLDTEIELTEPKVEDQQVGNYYIFLTISRLKSWITF